MDDRAVPDTEELLSRLTTCCDMGLDDDVAAILSSLSNEAREYPSAARVIVDALRRNLADRIRIRLIRALAGIRDRYVVAALCERIISDRSVPVRLAALDALTRPEWHGALDVEADVPLEEFVRLASSNTEDSSVRKRVVQALRGRLSDDRLAARIQSLLGPGVDPDLRWVAADALSLHPSESTVDLFLHLADTDIDPAMRIRALTALDTNLDDPRVVQLCSRALLRGQDDTERQWGALLLGKALAGGKCEPADGASVMSILCTTSASDKSPFVRAAALLALGDMVEPKAVQQIVQSIQGDPDGGVRASAVDALIQIASRLPGQGDYIRSVLRSAANDADPKVSQSASAFLRKASTDAERR